VRRLFRRGRLDVERAHEMQAHLEHYVDDLMAAGQPREQAVREAARRLGNPTAIREEIYEMNSVPILEPLFRDLRYAGRMLRKSPGFALVALVTLAVGIGVNTAVFTVVNALLLRPLPYPEPERLATILTVSTSPQGVFHALSGLDGATYLALRDNATTIAVAARGASGWGVGVNMVAQNRAANVTQTRVSAGYFTVLGILPAVGREFTPDEDRPGGAAVAILSHELWRRTFGGDRGIVGTAVMLRGEPYTVVGVMPAGFTGGGRTDVWTPLRPSASGEGGGTNYTLFARLRPGVSRARASAEVAQIASPVLARQHSRAAHVQCSLVPLQQGEVEGLERPLLMLWGAVGVVLLIACVNVAGLLIARSGQRAREIATRMALGSGRRAVIRQLLVESAVLALAGGLGGIAVGWGILETLERLSANVFAFGYPVTLDARVLATSLTVALGTSVVFGLVPALQASRLDVSGVLVESGTRSIAGHATGWSRRVLVVGEVALGVVLLVGAGLLVRTFVHLRSLDPGFDAADVTTATISLQDRRYEDPARLNRLFTASLEQIRRQPGVQAAGIMLGLPYSRLLNMGFGRIGGRTDDDQGGVTNVSYITPGVVEALRLPLRRGRVFTDADRADAPPVAIVNEEFARRHYAGRDVVGFHIRVAGAERQIVGIVGNARASSSGLGGDASPIITPFVVYVPAAQVDARFFTLVHTWFAPSWVVRASGPVAGVAEGVRAAVAGADPLLPIAKIESMADVQAASIATQRFMMALVAGLGGVALLLAAIGIHGLIASSVVERTRELGIRMALGATIAQVIRAIVAAGMILAAIGIVLGSLAALAVVRLLRSFLWGVTPTDPLTFGLVVATLLAVAVVASVVPALRVLRLDPVRALRAE
jgi:predicted permease